MRWRLDRHQNAGQPPLRLGTRIPLISLIQTLAVAEYLSIRHAANFLGMSPSSVSARIRALETELGIRLFERHVRGVQLTDAGKRFLETVAVGVDNLDHALNIAGATARGESGRLRIGVPTLTPQGFLDRLLRRYHREHPGVELKITECSAREAVIQLRRDSLDIAFVAGVPFLPDFRSRQIWTEILHVALPEGHPLAQKESVSWEDLVSESFIVSVGGSGPQVHAHIMLRLAGVPSVERHNVGRCTLLTMVAQEAGCTLVGGATTFNPVAGVAFRPVSDEPMPIPYSAVWSPFNRSPPVINLLDLATQLERGEGIVHSS